MAGIDSLFIIIHVADTKQPPHGTGTAGRLDEAQTGFSIP